MDKYETIEGYINGVLSEKERLRFEEQLAKSDSLRKEVESHRAFAEQLRWYGKRQALKEQMDLLHQEMTAATPTPTAATTQTSWKHTWKRHLYTVAVAASVALVTVIGILWNVRNYSSLENKQIGYYQALKKDLDEVIATQRDLVERSEEAKVKALPVPPVNSTATAFAIARQGYLITNYHVVKDARAMFIETKESTPQRWRVEVFHKDKESDLALLKIVDTTFTQFSYLPYSLRTEMAALGEEVFTLAYPRDDMVYGEGAVSSKTGFEGDTIAYQISIPVNPGNSGSPLLDERGHLIGMISGKNTKEEGAAYAIKAKYIQALVDSASVKDEALRTSLPRYNQIQYLKRTKQIEQLQDFVFELKIYAQTFSE
ncbi:MAG: serine protease [Bacteroidota bacterium]